MMWTLRYYLFVLLIVICGCVSCSGNVVDDADILPLLASGSNSVGDFYYLRNEEHIGNDLAHGKVWEKYLIDKCEPYIANSHVILDIGGHVGTHSIAYGKINPNVLIHTFEPLGMMYKVLKLNINRNNLSHRIIVNNLAVGHKSAITSMSSTVADGVNSNKNIEYSTGNLFNFGGLSLGDGGDIVHMITVDQYVSANNITQIGFMKIDIEGAEKLAILGAKQTIEHDRPVILYEKNSKQITPQMITNLDLTTEVDFNIEDYLQSLNYKLEYLVSDVLAIPNK
jgi:FkbM family methyltransferase